MSYRKVEIKVILSVHLKVEEGTDPREAIAEGLELGFNHEAADLDDITIVDSEVMDSH